MQTTTKTVPNTNITKKAPHTPSQIPTSKVNTSSKANPNKRNDLTRLLAACCDCV